MGGFIDEDVRVKDQLQLARFTMDRLSDGIAWAGPNAALLYVNEAACRMLGYSHDELLERSLLDINPHVTAEAWPVYWEDLKGRGQVACEASYRMKSGHTLRAEVKISYLCFDGKEYMAVIMRDVRDPMQTEDALRAGQERVALALEGTKDGIWYWNVLTGEKYWSNRLYELLGYQPGDFVPGYDTWVACLHPDDRQRVIERLHQHLDRQTPYDLEYRLRKKDGDYGWFHAKGQAVWDASGKALRMAGSVSDVTERKHMEEALRQSHAHLEQRVRARTAELDALNDSLRAELRERALIEEALRESESLNLAVINSFPAHVAVLDREGRITSVNESWLQFGLDNGPVLPSAIGVDANYLEACRSAIHAPDGGADDALDGIESVLKGHRDRFTLEYSCHSPSEKRWFAMVVTPLSRASGGAVVSHFDITERKRTEEEARGRAERSLWMQGALLDLTRLDGSTTAFAETCPQVTEIVAATLGVERVSVWLWSTDQSWLVCQDLYERSRAVHSTPSRLTLSDYPRYVKALKNDLMVGANDARIDSRTSEFAEPYLIPLGITSMLDVPIRRQGQCIGVLCCEHVGPRREWSQDEQSFAASVGETIARMLETAERRQTEDRLRKTQYAVDHAIDYIFVIGDDGYFLDVNESACRRLGYTKQELLTKSVMDIDPDFPPTVWKDFWEEFRQTKLLRLETRHRSKSGEIYPVEVVANYILHEGKELDYAFVRDISERKQAEEALRTSEERLRLAMETAHMGVWDWNVAAHTVTYSHTLGPLFGLPPGARHATVDEFLYAIHPDDRERIGLAITRSLETGAAFYEDYRTVWSDGTVHWLEDRGQVYQDQAGKPLRMIGAAVDITERKEVEKAIRVSQQYLQSIVEGTTDAVFIKDLRGRYLLFNSAAARFVGKTPEEVLGHDDTFIMSPASARGVMEKDRVVMANGTTVTHEDRVTTADGRSRTFMSTKGPLFDSDGAVVGLFGISRDITERKLAEESLCESERHLVAAQSLAHLGSWTWDIPTGVNIWSDENYRIFGYEPRSIQPCYDLFAGALHPEDRARVLEAARAAIEDDAGYDLECRIVRPSGEIRYVLCRGEVTRDEAGRPLRMAGTVLDITDRKRAEEALLELQRQLEERVKSRTKQLSETNSRLEAEIREHATAKETLQRRDAILQAVSFAAKEFLLAVSWNGHLMDVLHRLGAAAAADHVCVFRNDRTTDGDLRMSLQAEWVAQGVPSRLEDARLQDVSYHDQGLHRWVENLSHGRPIVGAVVDLSEAERFMLSVRGQRSIALIPIFVGQEWWGMMVFGLIRHERSWQSAEIEALQIAASTLGANIQRQWMEAQIRLYTEELEQLVTQRTERIQELESQRAQTEKLAALGQLAAGVAHEINNPIAGIKNAFLVLKDGIPPTHPYYHFVGMIEREIERVASIVRRMYDLYRNESRQEVVIALDTLIEDSAYLLKPKLAQRKVALQSHIASGIPPLRLVPRDLLQVLLNLVQNAVEASPDNGVVVIDVTRDQDCLRISVSDQGHGIVPEELPRIFEPFFSGQLKRKQGGIGLGLSVSYGLVQAMGGRIDVISQPNRGATFTVVLPLASVSQTATHSEGETQ